MFKFSLFALLCILAFNFSISSFFILCFFCESVSYKGITFLFSFSVYWCLYFYNLNCCSNFRELFPIVSFDFDSTEFFDNYNFISSIISFGFNFLRLLAIIVNSVSSPVIHPDDTSFLTSECRHFSVFVFLTSKGDPFSESLGT